MWDLEVSIFRDFPVDVSSSNLIPGQESLFKHRSLKKKKSSCCDCKPTKQFFGFYVVASHVDSMVLLKFYFSWLINRWIFGLCISILWMRISECIEKKIPDLQSWRPYSELWRPSRCLSSPRLRTKSGHPTPKMAHPSYLSPETTNFKFRKVKKWQT